MRQAGGSEELVAALSAGEDPDLEPQRIRRLIHFARKLTLLPNSLGRKDVDDLRRAGLSDVECVQAVQVAAYFNFANRLANGLGVELESE